MCTSTPQGLRRLFGMLDENNDNVITGAELKKGLKSFGLNDVGIKTFLERCDLNRDGNITWDEYKKAMNIPDEVSESVVNNAAMWNLFRHLDQNNDKKISKKEWYEGMEKLGMPKDEIEFQMKALDIDNDGFITEEEYRVGCGLYEDPIKDWRALFNAMDKDKSGDISVDELATIFQRCDFPVVNCGIMEWIKAYDKNNDGKLSYDEFLKFVKVQVDRS